MKSFRFVFKYLIVLFLCLIFSAFVCICYDRYLSHDARVGRWHIAKSKGLIKCISKKNMLSIMGAPDTQFYKDNNEVLFYYTNDNSNPNIIVVIDPSMRILELHGIYVQ